MAEIILAEQTLEFEKNGTYDAIEPTTSISDTAFEMVAGDTYTVVWDGTQYVCVAESGTFGGTDAVTIGNLSLHDLGEDTGEPFVIGYIPSYQMNMMRATGEVGLHTLAIYSGVLEEETTGANIVLYDRNGNPVTYEGIETVTFNTDKDGETATYTHGKAVDEEPVTLDLSKGNQTVTPADGDFMKKAVIQKPEGLLPENIKKGVEIAGVEGEMVGTGVSKEVELNLAEGDQTVQADEDTLMSEVVIKKPETLLPENIKKGVNIAGVSGNAPTVSFDPTDENLKYVAYYFDVERGEVQVRDYATYARQADTGVYQVDIPNTLGGCPVSIDVSYQIKNTKGTMLGNIYMLTAVNIGEKVGYVNNTMFCLIANSSQVNSPLFIPDGVTNIASVARGCSNFNQPVNIPDSVIDASLAFSQCYNFNKGVQIGNGVQNMQQMFYNCQNFNQPITLPNSVSTAHQALYNCRKFNQPVAIPDSVVNMDNFLYSGASFNRPITIGNNVVNAYYAFYNCKMLSQNIIIHSNVLNNCKGMFGSKNNSKRLNIFVHAGSSTETKVKNATTNSVVGSALTWTADAENNCCYNTAYNIYIYNTL